MGMNKVNLGSIVSRPGVYFFKDAANTIIYIGKASCLRKRIASYFSPDLGDDYKIGGILRDSYALNYIVTSTDLEASLLEADLIQRYQPKYNTLLKDGQPFIYILFSDTVLPEVSLVRNKKKRGTYFGPFLHKAQARAAHRYIIKTFKLLLCNKKITQGCLDFHMGICAGICRPDFDEKAYIHRVHLACELLRNDQKAFLTKLHNEIADCAHGLKFEQALQLQHYAHSIESIFSAMQIRYKPERFYDKIMIIAVDKSSLVHETDQQAYIVQQRLKTDNPLHTIDCFDISHFQSNAIVGSCVRFINGKPDTASCRRFKIRTLTQQNDYAALQEVVKRRYKAEADYPDLILIDGGKGQLNAVMPLVAGVPIASLAKREERLFSQAYPEGTVLNLHEVSDKLLIALRDYAHHFAINYHRLRTRKMLQQV